MEQQENLYQMGAATYVIERVFSQRRTPRDVVVEEIITCAKQNNKIGGGAERWYNGHSK